MKYILLHDFATVKQKKWYLLGFYLFIVASIFFAHDQAGEYFTFLDMICCGGMYVDSIEAVFSILMFLFHTTFFVYIGFMIFSSDLKYGCDNLFLRLKTKDWFLYKIISLLLVISLLKLISFGISVSLWAYFHADITILLRIFLFDVLFSFSFILFVYIFYILLINHKGLAVGWIASLAVTFLVLGFFPSTYGFYLQLPYFGVILGQIWVTTLLVAAGMPWLSIRLFESF